MPTYHVERSIVIDKPLETVQNSLRDFKQWSKWSPWLIMEPDATLTYSDRQGQVGATYGWSGILIGSGSMELAEVHDDALEMQLNFVKPFKSKAGVGFALEELNGGTKVTWKMDGHLPFFMFWMTNKMKTFIGMDYERGLRMLKEYLETGKVASYVFIEGILPLEEQHYIGIPRTCAFEELGEVMKQDYEALYHFMQENNISTDRVPFTIYNTFDMFNRTSQYIACIPVEEEYKIKEKWVRGTLQTHKALKTMHKGNYMHLGNAWMTAMNFARLNKIKVQKSTMGYEFYLNDPQETPVDELVTEIYLPLK